MDPTTADQDAHAEWQDHRAAVAADLEPGWEADYRPGTFGCHELLDRIDLVADLVETRVLWHPSCAAREEWYRLAGRAVTALRELYQRVGAEHVAAEGTGPDPAAPPVSARSGRD